MNRLVVFAFYFIIALIFLSTACDDPPTNGGNGDGNGNDTIPATMPQEHIPWPSLAASPWPMYMHDPQHTGRSPYEGPSQGEVNWGFPLAEMFSNPVIDLDGNILLKTKSYSGGHGKLVSLSSGGNLNWELELGPALNSTPLITSDSLIYVTYVGSLAQLDQSGNLRWTYSFSRARAHSTYSPNISRDGGTIYVCGFDSALYAINRDGSLQWKYSISPALSWGEPALSPDGNTIYFVGSDFTLYAINRDGSLNWSVQPDDPWTWWHITSPVIDTQGNIYLYAGKTIYAYSPGGSVRWQRNGLTAGGQFLNGCTIGPDGTIYVTTIYACYAFDYAGNLKWEMLQDEVSGIQNKPVVDIEGNIYLGTFWNGPYHEVWPNVNFVSIDPQGAVRYKILLGPELGGLDIDSPACIDAAGNLYAGSDGSLSTQLFSIR